MPESFGEPPRTGRFWFDLLAAVAAIFISVVSLVVAIRGERTQRGLLAANSWPFVQLSEDQVSETDALTVENAGVGPAKIISFEVFYKGQPVESALDLLRQCCGLAPPVQGKPTPSIDGYGYGEVFNNVLRPGERIAALTLKKTPQAQEVFSRFGPSMKQLSFRICYCSVLGECWTSDLRDLTQNPVGACAAPPHQFVPGE